MARKLSESAIEKKVCKHAEKLGWQVRKVTCPGRRGFPDRLFYRNAHVFFIEFKAPGKKPRKNQLREIESLRQQRIACFVVDDIEQGIDILEWLELKK